MKSGRRIQNLARWISQLTCQNEKDPRDIVKDRNCKKSGIPGVPALQGKRRYAGHLSQPARQNHRIIPITLCGEQYYLQYSSYVYYNEHCIIFNEKHIPMAIDRMTFNKLLDFVKQFPHYTAGSNDRSANRRRVYFES